MIWSCFSSDKEIRSPQTLAMLIELQTILLINRLLF